VSVPDHELEQEEGEPEHVEDEDCRCRECVSERIDYWADMEISE
jgi:hypothetical protein